MALIFAAAKTVCESGFEEFTFYRESRVFPINGRGADAWGFIKKSQWKLKIPFQEIVCIVWVDLPTRGKNVVLGIVTGAFCRLGFDPRAATFLDPETYLAMRQKQVSTFSISHTGILSAYLIINVNCNCIGIRPSASIILLWVPITRLFIPIY